MDASVEGWQATLLGVELGKTVLDALVEE